MFIVRTSEGRGCPLGNENGVKLDYIYTRAGLLRKLVLDGEPSTVKLEQQQVEDSLASVAAVHEGDIGERIVHDLEYGK